MGYGSFTHGESVMIGMIFALNLSRELLGLSFDLEKFIKWIKDLGYLTEIPDKLNLENLLSRMKQDKKSVGGSVRFVLLEEIGKPVLQPISDSALLEKLKRFSPRRIDS